MYLFKTKKRFRKLSIFILVPYFILCLTAGGFHALDERAYHGHADSNHSVSDVAGTESTDNGSPIYCYNDHSEDNCIVCKWLKQTPKKVHLPRITSSFILNKSALCINDRDAYNFLNNRENHSRAPPSIIS